VNLAFSRGLFLAVLISSRLAISGDVSYVVLNGRPSTSGLVRVSEDGKLIETIARNVTGYGLAIDHNGDYIVAAVSQLLRVSRSGQVSTIADTPGGSQWMSVVVEPSGDFLVADNRQHALWRVGSNGAFLKISNYPAPRRVLEDVEIAIDESGNYLVIEENSTTGLFRVTPQGTMEPVPLRGDRIPRGGHIILDGSGGYLATSLPNQVFRVTSTGEATLLATLPGKVAFGLARNPSTGEIVVGQGRPASLARLSSDGKTVSILAADPNSLQFPVAVIVEDAK
jgi:DNA-binding beta-propeller fold protein YncE